MSNDVVVRFAVFMVTDSDGIQGYHALRVHADMTWDDSSGGRRDLVGLTVGELAHMLAAHVAPLLNDSTSAQFFFQKPQEPGREGDIIHTAHEVPYWIGNLSEREQLAFREVYFQSCRQLC